MRFAIIASVLGLLLAGCASVPKGVVPDGTYRSTDTPGDALVIDGSQITFYLPTLHREWKVGPYGREFAYRLEQNSSLRLFGSSNDSYFLRQNCDWRWNGAAIDCARKDGSLVRFTRNTAGSAMSPATPEQQVWLAVAQRVRENESSFVRRPGALPVHFRTSFPSFRASITQMEKQAHATFCGLSQEESNGVVRTLRWMNRDTRAIGDVFEHRSEFAVSERGRRRQEQLGLSRVMFNRAGDIAYVNADIGGHSGSIVQMKLENGEWRWVSECATWVSWR